MKYIFWEGMMYAVVLFTWWAFRRFAKRNVWGDLLAGSILGFFSEFVTEALCDYHFLVNIYRDLPLAIVLAWGVMYTTASFLSERIYCAAFRREHILPYDKRILVCDVTAGAMVGFPLETVGSRLGLWEYHYEMFDWNWGMIPVFKMPYEILAAYMLLMLTGLTFVRYWQGSFEGRPGD